MLCLSLFGFSIAFILYLNHLFYSIFMINFKLCYRLLSFIPIFSCAYSLYICCIISRKKIFLACLCLFGFSLSFFYILITCFIRFSCMFLSYVKGPYLLFLYSSCVLFSLNMLYYIQEKGIYAMPKLVWIFYTLYFIFKSLVLFDLND